MRVLRPLFLVIFLAGFVVGCGDTPMKPAPVDPNAAPLKTGESKLQTPTPKKQPAP